MLPPGVIEIEMRAMGKLDRGEALAPIADFERLGRGQDGPAEIHALALPSLQPPGLRSHVGAHAIGDDRAPPGHVLADGLVGQVANDGAEHAVARHLPYQRGREAYIGIHDTYVVRHELKKLKAE
ncbi:MAG TPA: hypothetical protein VIN38_04155 [Thiobacillus sp.]